MVKSPQEQRHGIPRVICSNRTSKQLTSLLYLIILLLAYAYNLILTAHKHKTEIFNENRPGFR